MSSREQQLLKIGFKRNNHQRSYELNKYDKTWRVNFFQISDYTDQRWNILIDDIIYDLTETEKQYFEDLREHPAYFLAAQENKKQILDTLNKYRADLEQVNHFKLDKTVNQEARIRLESKVECLLELQNKLR